MIPQIQYIFFVCVYVDIFVRYTVLFICAYDDKYLEYR